MKRTFNDYFVPESEEKNSGRLGESPPTYDSFFKDLAGRTRFGHSAGEKKILATSAEREQNDVSSSQINGLIGFARHLKQSNETSSPIAETDEAKKEDLERLKELVSNPR